MFYYSPDIGFFTYFILIFVNILALFSSLNIIVSVHIKKGVYSHEQRRISTRDR